MNHRCITIPLSGVCGLFAFTASAVTLPESVNHRDLPIEKVFEAFRNPAAEARPFVRWWWNNNQVEEKELLRELDVLKAAGIGGVEINPIAGTNPPEESKAKVLTWRSSEWDRMDHHLRTIRSWQNINLSLILSSAASSMTR